MHFDVGRGWFLAYFVWLFFGHLFNMFFKAFGVRLGALHGSVGVFWGGLQSQEPWQQLVFFKVFGNRGLSPSKRSCLVAAWRAILSHFVLFWTSRLEPAFAEIYFSKSGMYCFLLLGDKFWSPKWGPNRSQNLPSSPWKTHGIQKTKIEICRQFSIMFQFWIE